MNSLSCPFVPLDVTNIGLDAEYFCCSEMSPDLTKFADGVRLRSYS
jgi:hypothetical protein